MRRMKLINRISAGLFAFVIMIGLMNLAPMKAQAYSYHFRLYAGNQGANAGEVIFEADYALNERANFTMNQLTDLVELGNSKYYIRGIRESGKDNNTVGMMSIPITEDTDYVVAYGIKGTEVEYTVNYHDASGNELHPSETYYGNAGDKPVVAYVYIDGYQPQAYNLTRTLREGGDNSFTFIYTPIETSTATPATPTPGEAPEEAEQTPATPATPTPAQQGGTTTTIIQQPATTQQGGTTTTTQQGGTTTTTQQGGQAATPQQGGQAATPQQGEQAATPGEAGNQNAENQGNANEPQELIDIDEQTGPLGEFETESETETETVAPTETEAPTETVETQQTTETSAPVPETQPGDLVTPEKKGLSTPAKVGIGAVIAVAVGIAAYLLIKRRNEE